MIYQKLKFLLVLLVSFSVFSQMQMDQLICNWNGSNYQPYNYNQSQFIGKNGFGFTRVESCEDSIQNANRAVCNWNGSNYQPYSIRTGQHIGKVDYGFKNFNSCKETTQKGRRAICNWNGSNYQPHNTNTGAQIGKANYGYNNRAACLEATQNSRRTVCNWNGSNYQPYAVRTGQAIGRDGHGFRSRETCYRTTNVRGRNICNWDGNAYSVYDIGSNSATGLRYQDLNTCLRYINQLPPSPNPGPNPNPGPQPPRPPRPGVNDCRISNQVMTHARPNQIRNGKLRNGERVRFTSDQRIRREQRCEKSGSLTLVFEKDIVVRCEYGNTRREEVRGRELNRINNNCVNFERCTEQDYFRQRPDVAQAAKQGRYSAMDHWTRHGKNENMCKPETIEQCSSRDYLSQRPDVAAAIQSGQLRNARQHYDLHGRYEAMCRPN